MTRTFLAVLILPLAVLAGRAEEPDKRAMPGGLGNRTGERRAKAVEEQGGSKESEAAVERGLRWLALHQAPDGHWSLQDFNKHTRKELTARQFEDDRSTGQGMANDTAGTAFGILPFLAAGITHKSVAQGKPHQYAATVRGGLSFLMQKQAADGSYGGGMYSHALAAIAVCEAYALTNDPQLKRSAQGGINYLVAAQHADSGGWRYQPKQPGDTSVTAWVIQALKAGQMAGLTVPQACLKGAEKWLASCEKDGKYGYTNAETPTPSMTAAAILSRQYLGISPRNEKLKDGVAYVLKTAPPTASRNIYYHYYATQAMHHMGGDDWKLWNAGQDGKKGMRDLLIERQTEDGSWDPKGDAFGAQGGRVMTTSFSLLTLQVYYRHVPLYLRADPEKK